MKHTLASARHRMHILSAASRLLTAAPSRQHRLAPVDSSATTTTQRGWRNCSQEVGPAVCAWTPPAVSPPKARVLRQEKRGWPNWRFSAHTQIACRSTVRAAGLRPDMCLSMRRCRSCSHFSSRSCGQLAAPTGVSPPLCLPCPPSVAEALTRREREQIEMDLLRASHAMLG
eukprot:352616-Chlamydomonas_euryale.AAC.3